MAELTLGQKAQDDLKELLYHIRFSKEKGGFFLLGSSGSKAREAVETYLTKELKKEYRLVKVSWHPRIEELDKLFPLEDPENILYTVEGLEAGEDEDRAATYSLLNTTREFYSKYKKLVIYWLPTEILYRELQWKAVDFWSFRVVSFDFFNVEDYRVEVTEKVRTGMEGYVAAAEKIVYLEDLLAKESKKKKKNIRTLTLIQNQLGLTYLDIGEFQKSLSFFQKALKISRELAEKPLEASLLSCIGMVYIEIGQLKEALKYQEESLLLSIEINDRFGEAAQLGNIGYTYQRQGEFDKALKYSKKSLALFREIDDKRGASSQLGNMGLIYQSLGQFEKALKYYEETLELYREFENKAEEAKTIGNIAMVYRELGQLEKALKFFEKSLALVRELGYKQLESVQLGGIGLVYRELGQFKKALKYFEESLIQSRELGYKKGEATQLCNIGLIYGEHNQPQKALNYFNEALVISKAMGTNDGIEIIQNNIETLKKEFLQL